MQFSTPLVAGRLIRRYMRFLADVELDSGDVIKAHCPNPGSMMGLKDAGLRVWLERNDDPRKKLDYGWRLIELGDTWVGIDTGLANRVVGEGLAAGLVPQLAGFETIRPEVKYGTNSRIDFLLQGAGPDTYVEVKSVTLSRQNGLAEFPDSVTARGAKHLRELADMARARHRAVMLFLVQRTDCTRVTLAGDIDPAYAAAFHMATQAGVEVICYSANISAHGITLGAPLPFTQP
ncbi:DNA/RNA nuclease SfsA [Octadecabacter sp. R77987]|uniref:DNA/RNA nuclease SfsA n=1 Tax=Octadecabacter sp. R77987 TaxID=3093874 RepID=UPI00367347FB